jgi:hypothetical protein
MVWRKLRTKIGGQALSCTSESAGNAMWVCSGKPHKALSAKEHTTSLQGYSTFQPSKRGLS